MLETPEQHQISRTAAARGGTATASSRYYLTHEHHPENGTLLGFWLYLMSDCLVFACLFAVYAVLGRNYAGGPSGAELFDLPLVAVNTSLLLLSSITYGFAMLEMQRGKLATTLFWLGFDRPAWRRLHRHRDLRVHASDRRGRWPTAQRFPVLILYSRRNTRVTCHVRHRLARYVDGAIGETWVDRREPAAADVPVMFWHFLDVVWIGVFTFVYLMGVLS